MPADCGGQRHEGLGRIFFILYSAVLRPIPDSDEEARERIFLIEKTITIWAFDFKPHVSGRGHAKRVHVGAWLRVVGHGHDEFPVRGEGVCAYGVACAGPADHDCGRDRL